MCLNIQNILIHEKIYFNGFYITGLYKQIAIPYSYKGGLICKFYS